MKQYRKSFVLLLAALLTLTACGGQGTEENGGIVYTAEEVPFTSPLDEVESACISGEMAYLVGTIYGEDASTERNFSLVRVPLEGGRAEELSAFHPAQLEIDEEYESTGGYLRPGADGTLWLTESVYVSGQGGSLVLRQLDSDGNELFCFDGSTLCSELGMERIYDLWTDGGTYFVNTGETVVLLNEDGAVRAVLEGEGMGWNRFVALSDGRTAILGSVQSMDGNNAALLRTIDTETGDWGEDTFSVPSGAACFQSGNREDSFFYYKFGDALYAWRPGAGEAEQVMRWLDSGVDANSVVAFRFLSDSQLAAVVYSNHGTKKTTQLTLLTPADAVSVSKRTVLSLAAFTLDTDMRAEIADFNSSSDSCFISVTEYLPWGNYITEADIQQAVLRMTTALTAGRLPDILYLNFRLPARKMEALGMLEDLWPYIDADPELNRNDLMVRPLEAVEYRGGLYRVAGCFEINTVTGAKDLVGDGLTWTYDDFWAAFEKMPEGSFATGEYDTKNRMLTALVQAGVERFVDWENGISFFDGDEFCALLEFCNRFPDEVSPAFDPFHTVPAISFGEQMLLTYKVSDFVALRRDRRLFGGEVSYVGWPNEAGQVGSVFELGSGGTTLSIAASSTHKDEAWSFLRRQLLPHEEVSLEDKYNTIHAFPINRSDFERMAELAMTPKMEEKDGILQEVPTMAYRGPISSDNLDRFEVPVYALTQEEYDQLMALYNAAEGTSDYDVNLMNIITEQAGAYFAGDRSLDDTVAAIQSRVGLYLAELQ